MMLAAIKSGIYEPDMDYPKRPKKPLLEKNHTSASALEYAKNLTVYENEMIIHNAEVKKYNQKKNECMGNFRKDVLEYCGIDPMHPKADKAYAMAWDRGKSSGLHEVVSNLEELAELLD